MWVVQWEAVLVDVNYYELWEKLFLDTSYWNVKKPVSGQTPAG